MLVYAATKNAGKLRELRAIFAAFGWDVAPYGGYAEPAEGDVSYADNAALKARALAAQLRAEGVASATVIADDSGLEVVALGGRPGVRSARYGGAAATWAQRRQRLLREFAEKRSQDRRARFVCAMHAVLPDGGECAAERFVEGEIAAAERGDGGFSYDAIFYYPPLGKTFGQLSDDEKNAISHRELAARALVEALSRRPGK